MRSGLVRILIAALAIRSHMCSENQLATFDEILCLLERKPDRVVAVRSTLTEERQLLQRLRLDVCLHLLVPRARSCGATTGDQGCGAWLRDNGPSHAAIITTVDCWAIREFADAAAAPFL